MKIYLFNEGEILVAEFYGNLLGKFISKLKPLILKTVLEDYKKIILDMTNVKDVDFKWCKFLIKLNKIMSESERNVIITGCSQYLVEVALVTGISSHYSLLSSVDEGINYFGGIKSKVRQA